MAADICADRDNDTGAPSIPARFENIVKQYSECLAVKYRGRALSYGELNEKCNRVARHLLNHHCSKIESAALLFERGIDVAAAMLGTLKAGARYCALDAQAPKERVKYILDDFQTDVILTNSTNFDLALELTNDPRGILNIDKITVDGDAENLGIVVAPEQIAYVVYTSGSTGHPRGVFRTHRGAVANAVSGHAFRQMCNDDRISLLHSVSFASGDADLYIALLNGAALLPFDIRAEGIDRLAQWLKAERISIFHTAPAVFRELCNIAFPRHQFAALRLIRLSGAAITRGDFDLYRTKFPTHTLLEVGMGSTEAEAICNAAVNQEFAFPKEGSPVGYARQGRKISILDDAGRELEAGRVGEIAVKSRDFNRGYWRRPNLTEGKFLRNPNGGDELTYLTGDLGVMMSDGFVIHLGRKDLMVKIRGYRVDLSEIEKALLKHPAIKDAGVAALDRGVGEKYLVGYVVASQPCAVTAGQLRIFLRSRLPEYMLPSNFVFLESLPLSNGKLDRAALPKPDRSRSMLDTPYVAAGNEIARQMVAVWEGVLDLRPIGVNDDFFDLGGHSLAGARIISEIHRRYGLDLPLRALFEAPTIAQLAVAIKDGWKKKTRSGDKDWRYLFELQSGRGRSPVFFFPGGGGSEPEFFIYARVARHLGSDYPVYGLRVRGADGLVSPHSSVKEMASAYLEDIRATQPIGPYYLIGECAGGVIAYEAARQLRERGEEVALLALLDVERPTLANYWRYRVREMLCISLIKFHWENLRRLEWKRWPAYLRGEGTGGAPSPSAFGQPADLLRARAQAVLDIDHLDKSAPHVERARTNYRRVVRRYRPQPYAGPVTILACEKLYREDPTLGWSELAQNGLRTHQVPGDHETYLREHVHVTSQQLSALIEEAQAPAAEHGARDEQFV